MKQTLEQFERIKQNVIQDLDRLAQLIQNYDKTIGDETKREMGDVVLEKTSAEIIIEQKKKIKDGNFNILVLGEFSCGKSTFLNALMREKILPTNVDVTTAAINKIQFSDKKRCVLKHWKEEKLKDKEIDVSELKNYITELTPHGKKYAPKIQTAEIYYPTEYCKNSVTIVDTPGFNSVIENHDKVTLNYLINGNAVIWLFNGTQPLTDSERNYLGKAKNQISKILFVIPKWNQLESKNHFLKEEGKKEEETKRNREKIVKRLQEGVRKETGIDYDIQLFPMNALMAENGDWENSGFQEFVTELERFLLSDEKTNQMLLPGIMDGLNEINNFESYIDTRIKGFTFSPKEFEDKIKKQYPQKEQILTDKNKMSDFIDTRKANLVQKLRKKSRDEINFTLNDISNYIESWNGEISNKEEIAGLKKQLAEYVKVRMMDMVEILKSSISDETNFIIEKTNMHYKQLISDIRQYQNNVSNLEDIVIEINTDDLITIDIEESTPDIIIPFVTILITTIVLGPLGLIAGFIFGVPMGNAYKEKQRKKLLGKVKSRVVPKLRKEFEKVTPQLLKALDKIIDDYKSKIISKLNAMIRNIENAIKSIQNEQENTKSDIEEKIRQLKVLKSNFDEIGQSLRASSKILN